ncbi:RNA polymerase II transcription factor SIII subunit A-domain-containing protein [Xylaria bambusicola]|uniref:RNA polymerase II transcription factor SIII subunit A-domain-containing protein n=1 Tax=Xylaria bambusicola TaxID=326684 RepID=UPI00200897D2|nr:RNA polymerase II transcription factor SIII subunit A-domain-containing protein [Xylaria bambusicola]KAI0503045.1 RNA polymerase II transcription factor SIII subunit A-domain-containing protein [Xylaria bambusicola]
MAVKSLVELCTAVCVRNIKNIRDIGTMPFHIARPILLKIDSPAQLREIEKNSPQLEEDTAELWKRLIARDFPVLSAREAFVPKNPRSWHKIYAKYQHEDAKAKEAAKELLKKAYKGLKEEKDRSTCQVVNYDSRKLPRLPRDVKPQVGIRAKGRRAGPDQSELRFTGGSRTKVNTPKSLLKRAMREAKEISTRNRLNTSAGGSVRVRPGQIARAPTGMVQEKVTKARPLTGIRPPMSRRQLDPKQREIEDREARLQRAKEMGSQKGGSYISDDDLDDLDIDVDDGPVGLEVDDLESMIEQPEPSYGGESSASSRLSPSAARGSVFARKMGSSAAASSISRVRTEAHTKPKTAQIQKEPLGPASPPPKPTPSSSSPGPGPVLPRKRKAVDVFMKPKPKVSRP